MQCMVAGRDKHLELVESRRSAPSVETLKLTDTEQPALSQCIDRGSFTCAAGASLPPANAAWPHTAVRKAAAAARAWNRDVAAPGRPCWPSLWQARLKPPLSRG